MEITIDSCVECKQLHKGNWFKETAYRLQLKQLCFGCDYWLGKVNVSSSHRQVRVAGKCYYIGAESSEDRSGRGFGGRRFLIRFHDGRGEVVTTNLWHNGEIPLLFRDRLPDNAVFI